MTTLLGILAPALQRVDNSFFGQLQAKPPFAGGTLLWAVLRLALGGEVMGGTRDDEPRRGDADQAEAVDPEMQRSIEDDEGVGYVEDQESRQEPNSENTAGMDPADSEDMEYQEEDRTGS